MLLTVTIQVMYMYYLLGSRLWAEEMADVRKQRRAENTFLLALDGDVEFEPIALILLIDLMKRNEKVGAACGRIHPSGSGNQSTVTDCCALYGHGIPGWIERYYRHVTWECNVM